MSSSCTMPSPSATCRPTRISGFGLTDTVATLSNRGIAITNPLTGKPGRLPSNLSGGLIGCMHAVGASGIMQVFEIATQLWGRWAEIHGDEKRWEEFGRKKPEDWTDLQVEGAKRALSISHAGVGSHVTATVLMDPDHLLKKDS